MTPVKVENSPPTIQPCVASPKSTPKSVWPTGLDCTVQFTPLAVRRIVPLSPTAQAFVASVHLTPYVDTPGTGEDCSLQVLPPSVVRKRRPVCPTATPTESVGKSIQFALSREPKSS